MESGGGRAGEGTCMLGPRTLAWSSVRYCRVFAGPLSRAVLFCRICAEEESFLFGSFAFGPAAWNIPRWNGVILGLVLSYVQMTPEGGVGAKYLHLQPSIDRRREHVLSIVPELTLPNDIAGKPANDTTDVTTPTNLNCVSALLPSASPSASPDGI